MSRCRYIADLNEHEAPDAFLAFPENEPITGDENHEETNIVNPDPGSGVPTAPITVTQDDTFRNQQRKQYQSNLATTGLQTARYNMRIRK